MRIGVPREIKNREHRVALTPEGAARLVAGGHRVIVQQSAGADAGFPDDAYRRAGADVVEDAADAWSADLVVKVKEPLPSEYAFLRPGLVLFTYLHLAAVPELAGELRRRKVLAIGYETVQLDDGRLPLLAPMSRIAGRLATQLGAQFLQAENRTEHPGPGRLLGGIEGVPPALVLIVGAGNVGQHAAATASGLGARVVMLEKDPARIEALSPVWAGRAEIRPASESLLAHLLPEASLLVGAALVPGEHAPRLLARKDLARMQPRSVFVDVAIDQGGISETSRPTTWDEPVYVEEGVLHCALPNMPAAVPESATRALTHATFPYIAALADRGVERAIEEDPALARGVNVRDGAIVHPGVARALAQSSG